MAAPKVFILPAIKEDDAKSISHTILTFKHPNNGVPTRYLVHHPSSSSSSQDPTTPFIYEILKVANQAHAPRSWLIAPDLPSLEVPKPSEETEPKEDEVEAEAPAPEPESASTPDSLVIRDAHLYLTTPLDPLYLLLPHLSSQKTSRNFLSFDDLLESHPESTKWSKILSLHPPSSQILQSRLLKICDTVSAGDEQMFRLNTEKLHTLLISRVESVAKALPPSLTKHIARKLSKPIGPQASTAWKRQSETKDTTGGGVINDAELEDQDEDTQQEPADSQLRREASKLNLEDSTTDTPVEESTDIVLENLLPPPEIQYLCHLSHSIQFLQNYLPQEVYSSLSEKLFTVHPQEPLEKWMEELKSLRAAANAAMDFSMSHSKRTLEDLEGGMSREDVQREKKRKKKEEDAKKSTAVKKLEKVDKTGMMKMTAFFKPKDPK